MKQIFVFLLALIGISFASVAEQTDTVPAKHVYVGAFAHWNFNFHNAGFSTLPGLFSCCPEFESGSGLGTSFGILADIPLKPKLFLGVRFGYSSLSGELTRDEVIGNTFTFSGVTDPTTKVQVEHSIDSKIAGIALEPQIVYYFFDRFSAHLGLKGNLLTTKTFTQTESIKSPNNVVFSDNGLRERNTYVKEKIPDVNSFLPSLTLGAGYSFALSNGLLITPEVRFELPFVNVSSVDWSISTLAAGFSVKYPLIPQTKIPEVDSIIYRRDTTMIETDQPGDYVAKLLDKKTSKRTINYEDRKVNVITHEEKYSQKYYVQKEKPRAGISFVGINSIGETIPMPQLVIEENEASETFPLLPYVFFNNAGSDLNTSGLKLISQDEAHRFAENKLNNWDALAVYGDMLNIIGSRMKNNPGATITITGCNTNSGIEENNTELSRRRAEVVQKYLHDTWNIDSKRMTIETRNLPINAASNKTEFGLEENRRVEIKSDNSKIMAPVTLREIHKTANPPIVRVIPKVTSPSPITSWNIGISQSSASLRSFSGSGSPEAVDWTVETLPIPLEESPVSVKLNVQNSDGQSAEAEDQIIVDQKTIHSKRTEKEGNERIDRFSLILFDYDKSEINNAQSAQINEIKSAIKSNSTVTITGYTDIKTGDKEYNKQLAMQRAQSVANKLGINPSKVKVVSAGGEIGLYDNLSPAGRSLSRTVKVIVRTPED